MGPNRDSGVGDRLRQMESVVTDTCFNMQIEIFAMYDKLDGFWFSLRNIPSNILGLDKHKVGWTNGIPNL